MFGLNLRAKKKPPLKKTKVKVKAKPRKPTNPHAIHSPQKVPFWQINRKPPAPIPTRATIPLKWKTSGVKQYEAVSHNKKYDFVVDARGSGVILNVYNHQIRDANKAYLSSHNANSVRDAKRDAANWM